MKSYTRRKPEMISEFSVIEEIAKMLFLTKNPWVVTMWSRLAPNFSLTLRIFQTVDSQVKITSKVGLHQIPVVWEMDMGVNSSDFNVYVNGEIVFAGALRFHDHFESSMDAIYRFVEKAETSA